MAGWQLAESLRLQKGGDVRVVFLCMMLFFLLPAEGGAQGVGAAPTLEWQEISVRLEPASHLMIGESTLGFAPGTKVARLRLSQAARVESVRVKGKEIPFSFANGVLTLELPAGSGTLPATVSYRAAFNDPVSRHPGAGEDPSYGVNAAITAEGTFLGGGAYWYPVPQETPASRKTIITAPAGIEGVTAGARVSRETVGGVTRSVWTESRPIGVLSLCAGPYVIEERESGGIKLYSYLYPGNAQLATRYLDATAKYLGLYQELFGRYPFEKFAVVENFFPTGYGFPSFTLLGGSVIRLPFIADTSLPHEIAHSWWGNGIDVDMDEGNWCEGLVTYLSDYLLKERRSKVEAAGYRRQLLIDYASLVNEENDFPLTSFTSRNDPASRAIGYGKAAMLFHMIRSEIGDEKFFSALRALVRDRMYGAISWSDLLAEFSRSSGRDISRSFKPWLTRTGGPQLSLGEVENRREGATWVVDGNINQGGTLGDVGVPLRLETRDGVVDRVVQLTSGKATRFAVKASSAPKRLLLDPDAEIFRILRPGEIPATVNSIKGSKKLLGVLTKECGVSRGAFRAFMASLSQGTAPLVDEGQLDQREASERDLLFCGKPANLALLPPLPHEVEESEFGLRGSAKGDMKSKDALLFLVLQRQVPAKGVVAVYQPLSEESGQQYGPKIMHYGKYGHLVFSGGSNRYKGTAPTSDGGVVVKLAK